ncbi:MAG TPA: GGDEF domain-containing protein [Streptosporangiaceae bacterium]|jgi:diguanylate cyclase (GGDEF)-like protein
MTRAPADSNTATRPRWPEAVRAWPVWHLESRLRAYVIIVIAAGAAALAVAVALTPWRLSDAILYAFLLAFGAITVEAIRPVGESAGSNKDAHGVWQLAAAILLPPFYALAAAVLVIALSQWRVRRSLAYRRVFSAAAVGLSYGAASLAFHAAWHRPALAPSGHAGLLAWGPLTWMLLAIAVGCLRWTLNSALVLTAVRLAEPSARIRDLLGGNDGLYNDIAEGCVGVLVALSAAVSPLMLIVALPCGTLLQRSARHSQLVQASRTDAKTGLLSAVTWQREAAVQVARSIRTRTPLSVAMVDIDHFKAVNDTYGHLAGDGVLQAVARILTAGMREYDLAGRFGGEEFTLLLPHADAAEAIRIAERLRVALAAIPILAAAEQPPDDPPHITVSIGVASIVEGVTDLTDLLAAADTALYRAKRSGRNAVRLAGSPPPAS